MIIDFNIKRNMKIVPSTKYQAPKGGRKPMEKRLIKLFFGFCNAQPQGRNGIDIKNK
jgi:hypothetical protein